MTTSRRILTTLGPLLGLALIFSFFAIRIPKTFLTRDNFEIMLLQTAVVATAALGMTMIIISGGIDLSVGSSIALSCVTTSLILRAGAPATIALLGGIGSGALAGLLNASLITSLRLMPFIVTLGSWGALRGLAKGLAGEQIVIAPDTWINQILLPLTSSHRWMLLPIGVWIMLGLSLLTAGVLRYTRFGRHVYAIGSNEQTAILCGVPVNRRKLTIYALAGALAGLAGVMQFSYLTVGDPTTATGMELNIIAAVVIGGASLSGGQGGVSGTLIGALIMTVVSTGCTKLDMSNWVQEIVTGGIIIAAVAIDGLRRRRT